MQLEAEYYQEQEEQEQLRLKSANNTSNKKPAYIIIDEFKQTGGVTD